MSRYRTIGEVEDQYFRDHPEEAADYLSILFAENAETGNMDTAEVIELSKAYQIRLAEYLINPPPVSESMKRAIEKHQKLIGNLEA